VNGGHTHERRQSARYLRQPHVPRAEQTAPELVGEQPPTTERRNTDGTAAERRNSESAVTELPVALVDLKQDDA
jgi:hypothetical protein